MVKKLILGGAGFLGSNLARMMVARGERPVIFTRPSVTVSNIEDILDHVDLIYGDFMDDVALRRAVHGVDTVYHLISTTFPSMTIDSSVYDVLSNLLPTIRLLEISRDGGVKKIVYASSGGTIYGEPKEVPVSESHQLVPKSAYGQSKLAIENYLSFYARTVGPKVAILRISNPFGPRQNPFGVQGLIAVAMGCAIDGRVLKIFGQGETIRDYIYIDDVVNALIVAGEKPCAQPVNISTGSGYSVSEIVEMIEKIAEKKIKKEFIPMREGDVKINVLSNKLAYEVYGWKPEADMMKGLEITWAWMNNRLRKN